VVRNKERVRDLLDAAIASLAEAADAFDEEYPPSSDIPDEKIIRVRVGENVQAALDQARTTGAMITLDVGEHLCNLKVNDIPDAKPVVITSNTRDIPIKGERINRDYENSIACIRSANGLDPVILYKTKSYGVHLTGIGILPQEYDRTVVSFGTDTMTSVEEQPHDVTFDRVLFLGDPERGQHRGIMAHCKNFTIKNSAFYDFHEEGRDSQAIAAWNGGQNLIIKNNFIEAGTENLLFGGGSARTEELAPFNIMIDGNTITKNPLWISGMEHPPQIKCLLEIKQARGITIQNNVFQHNWTGAAMNGVAIVFKCCDQSHNEPWTLTENVVLKNNIIEKVGAGIVIVGANDDGYETQLMRNVTITNNLFIDMDRDEWQGSGKAFAISIMPNNLLIDHNTILGNTWGMVDFYNVGPPKGQDFTFINTVIYQGDYGIKSKSGSAPENWATDLGYTPEVTGLAIRKDPARTCKFGEGNLIIPEADFDSSINPDYSIRPDSAIASVLTTDGDTIGCDISLLP
jgi:hypothetical protein